MSSFSCSLEPESAKPGHPSDDPFAFPPPPPPVGLPVFSASLPNSPALCKKTSTYSPHYRPPSVSVTRSNPPPPGRQDENQNLYSNVQGVRAKQVNQQRPVLRKQRSIDELRSAVQTVAGSLSSRDVRHLGPKMAAATELMTDDVEENAQALNLLVDVVDKLQGLVASKGQTSASLPRHRPRRVSSLSPKAVRRVRSPYPPSLSASSSSTSGSSSSSLNFCPDAYKPSRRDPRKTVTFGKGSGSGNGQVRLNNGAVSRAPSSDQHDCNTSCLMTKRKKKK